MPTALPRLVAHADWSAHPRKRRLARAALQPDGRYSAFAPEPVGPLDGFAARLAREPYPSHERSNLLIRAHPHPSPRVVARGQAFPHQGGEGLEPRRTPSPLAGEGQGGGIGRNLRWLSDDGAVLLGFDFPIGLPRAYAEQAGIHDFAAALPGFGTGRFADFYKVAREADEVCLARPFYPDRVGGRRRAHLLEGLGLFDHADLLRRCERRTATRNAACALFWTLGGNQVGKAAITGWRDLLVPALRSGADLAIWPFHGQLEVLLQRHRFVVAETYPGEVYRHLGLELRGGKRRQEVRKANAARLIAWADGAGVDLAPALVEAIEDGFGSDGAGEDRFDAVIGLLGMLGVVLGRRQSGEPDDPVIRRIEGWILGQQADQPVPFG